MIRPLAIATAWFLMAAAPLMPPGFATPAATPYDVSADAHAAVAAAFSQARTEHKLVLLDFGGNWCPDCRMLAGVLQTAPAPDWEAAHFVTVYIDVGRYTKNMDIAAKYGVKVTAVPAVLVLTPAGALLNPVDPLALANARSMSAQAVMDLLQGWVSANQAAL